jgi:hypothetical protein
MKWERGKWEKGTVIVVVVVAARVVCWQHETTQAMTWLASYTVRRCWRPAIVVASYAKRGFALVLE